MAKAIEIGEGRIKDHLVVTVRDTVGETLNHMLKAEADRRCRATRYERSPERVDTRAVTARGGCIPGQERRR